MKNRFTFQILPQTRTLGSLLYRRNEEEEEDWCTSAAPRASGSGATTANQHPVAARQISSNFISLL